MRPTPRGVLLVAATTALVAASTTAYAVSPGPWDVTRFATPGSVGKCPLEACHPVEWAVCRGRIGGEVPTRGLTPRRVGGLPREDRWGSAHSRPATPSSGRFATRGSGGKCPLEACHPVEWAVCRGRIGGQVPTRGLPPRRVGGLPREDRWGSAHSTWRPTPWGLASGGDGGGRDVGKLVA